MNCQLQKNIYFYAIIRKQIRNKIATAITMNKRYYRSSSILVPILLLITFLFGCYPTSTPPAELTQGSSKSDVISLYGEPDRTQEFIIPDEPFFGPQENLVNLVPPGTLIEEWVYESDDEELYIWFTGSSDEARENWHVLELGGYPKGAVY